jgi:Ras-related protein Rab-5C
MVGEPSVGKTSLLLQFNSREFEPTNEATIGASFISKQVETPRGVVNLLIWDTAGQERYRSLIPMYARNAAAALLVVDVSSRATFESLESWYNRLKDNCPGKCRFYLVANKMDLEPEIPIEKLKEWGATNDVPLFFSSAKDYDLVEPIFKRIAEDTFDLEGKGTPSRLVTTEEKDRTKGGCHC